MATTTAKQPEVKTQTKQPAHPQRKIQELRELFADAPELGKKALENVTQRAEVAVEEGVGDRDREPPLSDS
jgi:hypothetical protein